VRDYVLELVAARTGLNAKLNIMREYLQAYILRIMHDEGVFRSTAFLGGTALRFLHKLPRFSEDLDFSITGDTQQYTFVDLVAKIKQCLENKKYVEIAENAQNLYRRYLFSKEGHDEFLERASRIFSCKED